IGGGHPDPGSARASLIFPERCYSRLFAFIRGSPAGWLRLALPTFRGDLARALRRTPGKIATHLLPLLVDRAKIIRHPRRVATDLQRRAMPVGHPHERAMSDETRPGLRRRAEPRPVGTRHAHIGFRGGNTTHSTTAAIGGSGHDAARLTPLRP